ncbi:hypothetical protein V8C37DRAFT_53632 [Trichoderma ceciliae]
MQVSVHQDQHDGLRVHAATWAVAAEEGRITSIHGTCRCLVLGLLVLTIERQFTWSLGPLHSYPHIRMPQGDDACDALCDPTWCHLSHAWRCMRECLDASTLHNGVHVRSTVDGETWRRWVAFYECALPSLAIPGFAVPQPSLYVSLSKVDAKSYNRDAICHINATMGPLPGNQKHVTKQISSSKATCARQSYATYKARGT